MKLSINDLRDLLGGSSSADKQVNSSDDFCIGKTVIIRTYSAGVWFGTLVRKAGNEVILTDARRLYQWHCKKSISLSAIVQYGILQDKSLITVAIPSVWLEAIEIMPIAGEAAESIRTAPEPEQE